jgi:membrane-associated protease RseP (regulator of RpoE activity)
VGGGAGPAPPAPPPPAGRAPAPPPPGGGAGIRPDDRIVAIEGRGTQEWDEIRSFIRNNPGEEVTFTIQRNGEGREVRAALGQAIVDRDTNQVLDYAPPDGTLRAPGPDEEVVGFFGVEPERVFETESLPVAMVSAGSITWEFTVGSLLGIREVFGMLFDGTLFRTLVEDGAREPGEGPVGLFGAGRIAGEAFERGLFLNLIFFIVGITIFIGLMNLLPLPPLDGGHLAVVAYEAITGKVVDVRKLIPVAAAVISFFLVLFVLVLYLDLARPIEVPF